MAIKFLRPGPWKLIYTGSSTKEIKIDNEVFEIPAGNSTAQTVEFDCSISASFDDSNLSIYRNPVAPVVSTSGTGGQPGSQFGSKTKKPAGVL